MSVKNNTHIDDGAKSNNRVSTACDICCCLLPQCDALRAYRSGFSIATTTTGSTVGLNTFQALNSAPIFLFHQLNCCLFAHEIWQNLSGW